MTDPHAEAGRIARRIIKTKMWLTPHEKLLAEAVDDLSAREKRLREALDFYAARSDEWMNKEARQALHDVYGAAPEAP